jgi:tripeptide aminopeptidase
MFIYADRLYHTLVDIIRIPSTSGHEEYVRGYLEKHLIALGLTTHIDDMGNLIATLDGEGTPLLLNAHMDRVPPGLGHEPIMHNGILYSDGSTNLGADDAAGMTIILEILRRTIEQALPHPPLVILFTVQEESGLCGAHGFEGKVWNVRDGLVFDNAFEAGVVVSKGASYEAFDVKITGRTGHPGKDITHTINAISIFKEAIYPQGPLALDQTRINIGRISGGNARNTIPDTVILEGEIRSFEPVEARQQYKTALREGFEQAAQQHGGRAEVTFRSHTDSYSINLDEPLLNIYQTALAQRGERLKMKPTFIGSDTGGFRPNIRAITISTGVFNEHTVEEYVALAPLEQIVTDTLQVLHLWRNQSV